MQTDERVIYASAGAAEYVTGRITERNGEDILDADFEVGLGGYDTPPATWETAANVAFEGTSVAMVSMLVDENVEEVERAHLWVRMADAPETLLRRADGGTVTVA